MSSLLRVFMPGKDWLKSMQTLVSKLLELDQDRTACKAFTDHFLNSEYSERLSQTLSL